MHSISAEDFVAIVASNNPTTLEGCLQRSPDVVSGALPVVVVRDAPSMTIAYNQGLDRTDRTICVFVHQDVYLPRGWLANTVAALRALSEQDPEWEVAGPFGLDDRHQRGRIWDGAFDIEFGSRLAGPVPVGSFDELLLILRRRPDYRFDEKLPGFHLYGTDIAQTALAAGRGAYAVDVPVVHNCRPVSTLRGDYARAWHYARRKWWSCLPIQTSVSRLSRNPISLWKSQWIVGRGKPRTDAPLPDSVELARRAGYE